MNVARGNDMSVDMAVANDMRHGTHNVLLVLKHMSVPKNGLTILHIDCTTYLGI